MKDYLLSKLGDKEINDVEKLYDDFIFLYREKYAPNIFVGTISDCADKEFEYIHKKEKEINQCKFESLDAIVIETENRDYKKIIDKILENKNDK